MQEVIDIWQLRTFFALAVAKSFTQAARDLHLSQSAISHSIKALERGLDCRLFDRVGKSVVLTLAGEHLLQHAERIMSEMGAARQTLEQLNRWGKGRLRLGATASACQHIIPAALKDFQKCFPDHLVRIRPGDSHVLRDLVLKREIDFALCVAPQPDQQIEFSPLFEDELHFVVGSSHPWAVAGKVNRDEISQQCYILYGQNSVTLRLVLDYFRQENISLNTVTELGDMQAAKELVKLAAGVSIIPLWVARREIEEGDLKMFPLGRRKLKRQWGILRFKDHQLTMPEERFITLCRSVTANFQ